MYIGPLTMRYESLKFCHLSFLKPLDNPTHSTAGEARVATEGHQEDFFLIPERFIHKCLSMATIAAMAS